MNSTRRVCRFLTAIPLQSREEWARLRQPLLEMHESFRERFFKPLVSIDTRHAETARLALENGADWINDVSGLTDPQMISVLQNSACDYVLMHSLTVPADLKAVIAPDLDVVEEVKSWAERKLGELAKAGVDLNRVILDPGVGFGKTPQQSITLLKRIDEFFDLPVRLLVGHSRKGFLRTWTDAQAPGRDPETLGVSLRLAERGVDILRVHEPEAQMRAFHAFREVSL
jgi:dihydropteroate synthase